MGESRGVARRVSGAKSRLGAATSGINEATGQQYDNGTVGMAVGKLTRRRVTRRMTGPRQTD
jgi:hypothetical protein